MSDDLTRLLGQARDGDGAARDRVVTIVYAQLKRIAAAKVRRQPDGVSVQATELVHEAYGKLFRDGAPDVKDRGHFFALAAGAMHQVLVDRGRARRRDKRKAPGEREPLDDLVDAYERSVHDLLGWDEALAALEDDDPRMAAAVRLRLILQLTEEEIARTVDIPLRSLQRRWPVVRRRLRRHLG
ncbi:MAG: ECF-type sigma factor [Planctomycetota bacterium JB042]